MHFFFNIAVSYLAMFVSRYHILSCLNREMDEKNNARLATLQGIIIIERSQSYSYRSVEVRITRRRMCHMRHRSLKKKKKTIFDWIFAPKLIRNNTIGIDNAA